ncbi:MAG: glycosyltransferase family 2 protein [Metallibacterium sp.]
MNLWILIPLFNEETALAPLQTRLGLLEHLLNIRVKVLYIDDGSTDASWTAIRECEKRSSAVYGIKLSRNFGKEVAMSAGLDFLSRRSDVDCAVIMDADLQDPPELIPQMVELWRAGNDTVYATRRRRDGESVLKKITARIFYRVLDKISSVSIPRDTGDFRLISHRTIRAISVLPERQRFMKGIFAWVGFSSAQIFYDREARISGNTKFNFVRLWRFAIEGITSFSTAPLRIASWIGLSASMFAVFYGLWIVCKVLIWGIAVPGYASLMVVILILGGLQLSALGIIGEYVGRTYIESKSRPLYFVSETVGFDLNTWSFDASGQVR